MNKSGAKVVELFVYAFILVFVIVWAVGRGGFYKPNTQFNANQLQEQKATATPTPNTSTNEPIYRLPPKTEFKR